MGHTASGQAGPPLQQYSSLPQAVSRKQSFTSDSTEEEKNHVIRVLQHESKVYNFEKNIKRMMGQAPPTPNGTVSPVFKLRGSQPF